MLSRVSRLARHLDRARRAAFAEPRPGAMGVRCPVGAAPPGPSLRAQPGGAAAHHAGDLGHHDQPDRPAGAGLAWSPGAPTRRTSGACWSRSHRRGSATGWTPRWRELLTSERALLHPIPEDSRRALAACCAICWPRWTPSSQMTAWDAGQPTGSGVREIAPGIWCWQRRPRGLRPGEFGARTSYAVAAGGETLLVDPLVDAGDDPALAALDGRARGRVRILDQHAVPHPQRGGAVAALPPRAGAHPRAPGGGARGWATLSGFEADRRRRRRRRRGPLPPDRQPAPLRAADRDPRPPRPGLRRRRGARRAAASCACGRTRWTASAAAAGGASATCRRSNA